MNNEEKLDLLDETIHWLQILFLEDVEKDIIEKKVCNRDRALL